MSYVTGDRSDSVQSLPMYCVSILLLGEDVDCSARLDVCEIYGENEATIDGGNRPAQSSMDNVVNAGDGRMDPKIVKVIAGISMVSPSFIP